MEKLNNMEKSLEDLISVVKEKKEYKTCIKLKKDMQKNEEINSLVKDIKKLQQQYIKSEYDEKIKEELEQKEQRLNSIPIYTIYNENLKIVNQMLDEITSSLNEYFYEKMNPEIKF